MPRFDYLARNATGDSLEGVISAPNSGEAARLLRADGKFVVRIQEAAQAVEEAATQISFGGNRVKSADVIHFVTQMSVMVDTGVSITEALHSINEQTESVGFRKVLDRVLVDVETGTPFSTALARHPKVFKPLVVNLVRASEASGQLGPMLDRCATYLTNQRETSRKVVGALIYPVFLMFMSIGVVIFLMTFLMPKFTGLYRGKEDLLPTPTKILMAISGWMTAHWIYWTSAVVILGVGSIIFFRSESGTRPLHWIQLKLPLFGSMFRKTCLTRSLRTLGTLTRAGVSILDSVGITRAVVGNRFYQDMWDEVDTRVQNGEQMSAPLLSSKLMPRSVTQMVRAGEKSGHLADVLDRVSDFLERDLEQSIKRVTQMIEPIMIFVMGGIVGSIVIALLLPILTISRTM
ncbi:MAG: type II secretion system F family protein, partial [Planctomycetes bacterium]|nr:type II secretion system F family protein [Planctomycetota bacterium]